MNLIVFGPCYICKHVFEFDSGNVSSVLVDPITELPIKDTDATKVKAEGRPICAKCVIEINVEREQNGLGPIPTPEPGWKE